MPKRKHSELENDRTNTGQDDRVNEVKATRLRHKFERGAQLLFRALKTARGFERQKLGRRQKTAKQENDGKTLERLEKEVQVLKALDLEETAERYLHKQLIKAKRISDSPEFARLEKSLTAATSATGPRDPAEANVTARLFKSNPVQNALPDILTDIRTLLGINEIVKKQQKQAAAGEQKLAKKPDEHTKPITSDSVHADNDTSMNDASDDDDGIDYAQFDSRLAPTSDASDSEEASASEHESKPQYNLADDISISSAASESSYLSEPSPPPKSELKSRTKKGKNDDLDKPPKDTTFLPSLMMGGYWSGSESGDDNDDDAAAARPQRKNRMGQQARRALWEKKFGTKANHLQKEAEKRKNKNSGWDMRRGATDDNDANNNARWAKQRDGQSQGFARRRGDYSRDNGHRKDANAAAGGPRSNKTSAASTSLHPSWEAARKAKEQKSQASFEGKKIVFD
ncbi:hypothetical protein UA08_03386 [Talaromyces atroroseus]|uniref:Bud22 domain-containing protein n=1 Tax=Talaromyces atroroseus TaxID=1441469 RepID=A0A225B321_TALAT|nr:hypothetical protein UA08_03386 [Talaromyces atroroseus]OKL61215.1 hypothetical protein UA08_03386 [Talaromyces atroroseus]